MYNIFLLQLYKMIIKIMAMQIKRLMAIHLISFDILPVSFGTCIC
jgi:hypothetical protein